MKDDWLQKAKGERKRKEQREKAIKLNIDILDRSGLLEKIEQKRKDVEKETLYRFQFMFPEDDSLRKGAVAHIVTSVVNFTSHGSFIIEVNEDGIYLTFSNTKKWPITLPNSTKPQKIDPQNVSDKEIHDWFGRIVPK